MTEEEARSALDEARLKVRAMRSVVRDVNAALARAEEALAVLNAQPKEAQRDEQDRNIERCVA
jgi:hypothetical protein